MASSLPDKTLEVIREVLERHREIVHAIVFGSLAAGRAGRDSDADVAVAAATPLTAQNKVALMDELAIAIGRPIDLIDLNRAGPPVVGQILKYGRRIVGTDERHATLISKHLLDEADFMPYYRRILAERRQAWIGS